MADRSGHPRGTEQGTASGALALGIAAAGALAMACLLFAIACAVLYLIGCALFGS